MNFFNVNVTSLLGAALLISLASQAHAQQNAFGANRRVTANGGFGGVEGTFGEPNFTINQAQFNQGTKPELYMGMSFRLPNGQAVVEADAGVTFSQVAQTSSITGITYPAQTWFGFSRITGGGATPGYQPVIQNTATGQQWRVAKGSLVSVEVSGKLKPDGEFQLSITHGGSSYFKTTAINWPKRNDGKIRGDVVAGMTAKRVIAATQNENPAGGPYYNGFSLTDATFSGGSVFPLSRSANGDLSLGADTNWDAAAGVNDEFLPFGRNGDPATGRPTGIFVIDLDAPHQRDQDGVPAARATLYHAETVNINLLTRPSRIGGRRIRRGNILNQY